MRLRIAVLLCLLCPAASLVAQELTNSAPVAVYDFLTEVSVSAGYRNNVLYSGVTQENSWFSKTALDTSLSRFSESGSFFVLYLLAEDTRYADTSAVNYEQLISGSAQYVHPVGERDEIGLEAGYLFLHQILDASETEADLYRILVEGHEFTLRPHWKHDFSDQWAVKLEAAARRQFYAETLDNFSEGLGKISLIHSYGNRSEASIGWQSAVRYYDTRNQYDRDGFSVAETDLKYYQNEFSSRWRHYWDAERNLQTTTRLSALFNRDNGSGYFDYDRLQLRQQIRWKKNNWTLEANAGFGKYLYSIQRVESERRERTYTFIDTRIERKISSHWRLHVATEQEWNESNDPLDQFRGWMTSAGATFEF